MIQDKIAETSIVKLPRLHNSGRSSQRRGKHTLTAASQQSLPDSGHASSSSNLQSQGSDRQPSAEPSEGAPSLPHPGTCPISEDDLPDLVNNHSDGLCDSQSDSQQNVQGSKVPQDLQESDDLPASQSTVRREASQPVSDRDQDMVEEFDSPPSVDDSLSQRIEDVESLSLKDCDSQRSEGVVNSLPDSLEQSASIGDSATAESRLPQPHANVCGKENDLSRADLVRPCPASMTDKEGDAVQSTGDAVTSKGGSEPTVVSSLQVARQKAVEQLAEKGVVPLLSRGNGQFIILDEEYKDEGNKDEKERGRNALMARLLKQYQKKEPRKAADVEIR